MTQTASLEEREIRLQQFPGVRPVDSELILEVSQPESSNEPSVKVLPLFNSDSPKISDSSKDSKIIEPAILDPIELEPL
jgi:hypothetical protein